VTIGAKLSAQDFPGVNDVAGVPADRADPGERRYNRAGMHAAGAADGAQTATRQELSADAIL
jgi:hypothetical protein